MFLFADGNIYGKDTDHAAGTHLPSKSAVIELLNKIGKRWGENGYHFSIAGDDGWYYDAVWQRGQFTRLIRAEKVA